MNLPEPPFLLGGKMRIKSFLRANLVFAAMLVGCAHSENPSSLSHTVERYEPPPGWILDLSFPKGEICSIGIAGPGTTLDGPRELAKSRAIDDLAHSIETLVWEGIIDRDRNGQAAVRAEEIVGTSGELILQLREGTSATWWFDATGEGFVGLPKYTYARVCTDKISGTWDSAENTRESGLYNDLAQGPAWLGERPQKIEGRLCAVGLSRRTYDPSDALEQASQDVRAQLSVSLIALVSSLTEQRQSTTSFRSESTTVGLNIGEVKGAVVREQWFDRDGVGPLKEKGAAYAYGCVFPEMEFERKRQAALEMGKQDQAKAFEEARVSARAFFDSMDEEEKKRADEVEAP